MKKEISKAWPTSLVNKKTIFWIVAVFLTIVVLYRLNIRICAPCAYRYNNKDYNVKCEHCVLTPKWKILFFNLTGKNLWHLEK